VNPQIRNRRRAPSTARALFVPLIVGLALAGCSKSSPSTAAPSPTSTASSTTTPSTAAGSSGDAASTSAFCQQYVDFINSLSANIVTPDGFAKFKQSYAALAADAPAAIQTDLASLSAQAQAMQSVQDVTSVTAGTAQNDVDAWVKANCPNFAAAVGG